MFRYIYNFIIDDGHYIYCDFEGMYKYNGFLTMKFPNIDWRQVTESRFTIAVFLIQGFLGNLFKQDLSLQF